MGAGLARGGGVGGGGRPARGAPAPAVEAQAGPAADGVRQLADSAEIADERMPEALEGEGKADVAGIEGGEHGRGYWQGGISPFSSISSSGERMGFSQ